jgi:hypothetical protein
VTPLTTQLLSALCWIIYASFFEWYWHKLWMHTPRTPKEAFRGHTIVHHGLYKGDESYFVPEGEHPEHILLKPYALPGIVAVHIPVLYAIERFLVPHTAIGAVAAMVVYFLVYEYMHWNMHVPRGHFVERFRWFQFLRQHHKLHHRYFQKNFCVLFPLADLCLGTLITEASLARQKAEREQAIASGTTLPSRKHSRKLKRRAGRVKLTRLANLRLARMTSLSKNFDRFSTRRKRESRRERRVRVVREMLETVKSRFDR